MRLFLRRQVEEKITSRLKGNPPEPALQIWLDDGGHFRATVISVLEDIIQRDDQGRLVNQRALLSHVQDRFSFFSQDSIDELEDLMQNSAAKERDFQKFFERHPRLLTHAFNFAEVHPQVHLTNIGDHKKYPDFILTDVALQKAAVIELKLPSPRIVRHQTNRDGFSSAIYKARTQLLRYREWFADPRNRQSLMAKVGMEIYRPKMGVIIGRSVEFLGLERQRFAADDTSDVEVLTYDEIVELAKRRKLIIDGSS